MLLDKGREMLMDVDPGVLGMKRWREEGKG